MKLISFAVISLLAITVSAYPGLGSDGQDLEEPQGSNAQSEQQLQSTSVTQDEQGSQSTVTQNEQESQSTVTQDKQESQSTVTQNEQESQSTVTQDKQESQSTVTQNEQESQSTVTQDKQGSQSTVTQDKQESDYDKVMLKFKELKSKYERVKGLLVTLSGNFESIKEDINALKKLMARTKNKLKNPDLSDEQRSTLEQKLGDYGGKKDELFSQLTGTLQYHSDVKEECDYTKAMMDALATAL
ncbi:hypothetical protein BASA50_006700 [Batrachochytrium salamandrivorans]|uniref:Uncharacterized protein n=1 Tax=Batrachochytrium salamandrivorans TaxID=1357716 RepID=A0ABQ8F9E3_9FUNG|nr:hypothetical protein BASA62_001300 [Batrachochytrium salamandrivorans]KAH6579424.1 hypothetical protein BASA60_003274 [Batrachochytrium salamandrivorans]KAH6594453.1 hypothetical protein BASA50_006700 [Batrachochytrium salamandrivorans]KAH6602979.1 hypothetical protein BASA61_000565 [Batrachochytrium salamandrivorans]KAH9253260.1 hypothetical protein BASA81_008771 [Batrachochytrium salamandrivorans]